MRIVFMGTPDFAVPSLERLIADGHEVLAVVTQPDKTQNRGMKLVFSPVKECALKHQIPVFQPEKIRKDEAFWEEYQKMAPDVAVVVAFGQILPERFLNLPKYGCINVHGSLLPNYRGAAPIQWSVINGDKVTGVTTMYMDKGLDTGDMILKTEVEIGDNETAGELYDRLSFIGADTLSRTLVAIEKGEAPREKQPEEFTYAPMLTKELGKIDWNKTSFEIKSLIRGVNPWPGAYTEIAGKKLKVHKAEISDKKGNSGEILCADDKNGLIIATADGALELLEIQPENKKRMNAKDFLRGNKLV
ncbi:MAG: methionyl-tRNA formyltransferase [Clostridia bacterium]|nr:methionyl-tRNA formyltransferase [Clostridia bacterium]